MPTPVDRDRLVPLLRRQFDEIVTLCERLRPGDWERPTCLPGWSVKDVVSHLVGTEAMLDGQPVPEVDVSHLTHVANEIGRLNERWVESLRPLDGSAVLQRFRDVTRRRLAALEVATQEELDEVTATPVGEESYGRFLRIRLFDCYLHEHDVREAVGLADRPDPEQLDVVLDEVAAGLGFVIAKRAAIPGGERVRVEVTDGLDRRLDFEVGERTRHLPEGLAGEPTVALRLPALLLLRLVGGRRDPAPHLGTDVALAGRVPLARRLAESLAYTV